MESCLIVFKYRFNFIILNHLISFIAVDMVVAWDNLVVERIQVALTVDNLVAVGSLAAVVVGSLVAIAMDSLVVEDMLAVEDILVVE